MTWWTVADAPSLSKGPLMILCPCSTRRFIQTLRMALTFNVSSSIRYADSLSLSYKSSECSSIIDVHWHPTHADYSIRQHQHRTLWIREHPVGLGLKAQSLVPWFGGTCSLLVSQAPFSGLLRAHLMSLQASPITPTVSEHHAPSAQDRCRQCIVGHFIVLRFSVWSPCWSPSSISSLWDHQSSLLHPYVPPRCARTLVGVCEITLQRIRPTQSLFKFKRE